MKAKRNSEIKPMGFGLSLIIGAIALAALFATKSFATPWFTNYYATEPIISWFICVSAIVFFPMLLVTYIFVRVEQNHFTWKSFLSRIRYKTLKSEDWLWVGFGIILILIITGFLAYILKGVFNNLAILPTFWDIPQITSDNRWILLAWLPMYFLNIVGEEFFWRGYMFPRQLKVFGKFTWFYNGVIWLLFHIPFGLSFMIIMAPTLFITTFSFQKTNNVKVPIIIHGIVTGATFLVIAFGYF